MKVLNWVTTRQVIGALIAAPLLLTCAYASAEEVAPASAEAAAPYTITYNLGLYSRYIGRGNNWGDGAAIQGGVDWAHNSGFYLGTWWSTTDPQTLGAAGSVTSVDPSGIPLGSGNHFETDWYGGYTHAFGPVTLGVGGYYVFYPEGEKSYHNRNQDNFEGNLSAAAYGFTYTYSYAFTDWYGIGNTRIAAAAGRFPTPEEAAADTSGAQYHELKYGHELPFAGLNFAAKVGYQRSSDICLNQKDFLIGLNKNFSLPTAGKPLDGFNVGFNYTGTFGVEECAKVSGVSDGSDHRTSYYTTDNGKVMNNNMITVFLKRTW